MAYRNPLRSDITLFCMTNSHRINTNNIRKVFIDCFSTQKERRMRVKFSGVVLSEDVAIELNSYLFKKGYRNINVTRNTNRTGVPGVHNGFAVTVNANGAYQIASTR